MKNTEGVSGIYAGRNRRRFLQNTSMAGLGVASAAFFGGGGSLIAENALAQDSATVSDNDVAILNFALNLEYLEAEFYTVATTGKTLKETGIPVDGTGAAGDTVGGSLVDFARDNGQVNSSEDSNAPLHVVAAEIAKDEQAHVLLLRSVLGAKAIAKPEINLNALGLVSKRSPFLIEARAFEDVGVSAYGGAAPLIQSSTILATAARIALTEGEHVGNLRLYCAFNEIRTTALDSLDILSPISSKNFFSVDQQGLTAVRTPNEVLAIVYGSSKVGTSAGGFFPKGANGTIVAV